MKLRKDINKMNLKKFKEKHILTIAVILFIVSICSAALAYSNNEKYMNTSNNEYNLAFYELIDHMEDVENYLAKSLVTKDANHSAETLMYVWRAANLSEVYLSQIPISNEGLSNTEKFLNQVSEYSYSLAQKCINDENLSKDELSNLKNLYNYSLEVNNTLGQISLEINNGTLNWKELATDGSSIFSKEVSNDSIDSFGSIESNFEEYDGLIYDGAYSEHITSKEKKGLTGDEIDEEKAKKIAEDFVGKDSIKEMFSNGLVENGNIKVYTFEITTNEDNYITIAISQKGGHIVLMNYNRDVEEEKISVDDADEKALEFLNSKGYTNMQKTYSLKEYGIITINYAYEQDNVIVYPDLIKIKVALDNGDILGIETTGYLNNHETRNIDKENIISSEEAAKLANENLKIENTRLAIIPTEFETEIFCWEIKGTVENRDFLLYVNAKTGKVEDILVIIETGNGILTQ